MDEEKLHELIKEGKTSQEVIEILQQEARENDKIFRGDILGAMMAVLVALLVLGSALK